MTEAPMTGPIASTTTPFTSYPPWANTDAPIMHESRKEAHSVLILFIRISFG
jgi:hypothetical protein